MFPTEVADYIGKRSIFTGGLNCGKTSRTGRILAKMITAGLDRQITILDFAPDQVRGAGGKLDYDQTSRAVYLTTDIVAPRLSGKTEREVNELALSNALSIEPLLAKAHDLARSILIINDTTIYLQAGSLERLLQVVLQSSTVVANAYQGDDFSESKLTAHERRQTVNLLQAFDVVYELGSGRSTWQGS